MIKRVCFSCVCGKCILRAEAIDLLSKHIWQDWNIKKNWEKFSNILKYRDVSFMQATKQRKKMRHFKKQAWISFLSAKHLQTQKISFNQKYVTKQIGLSKLNAFLILSFEWKLILKAETMKLIWHNWALF